MAFQEGCPGGLAPDGVVKKFQVQASQPPPLYIFFENIQRPLL